MNKKLMIILMGLLLTACSPSRYDAAKQQQEWQVKLNTLPIGATAAQVEQWAGQNHIALQIRDDKTGYYAVQPFPAKGLDFCVEWRVILSVDLNDMHRVQKKEIKNLGVCL